VRDVVEQVDVGELRVDVVELKVEGETGGAQKRMDSVTGEATVSSSVAAHPRWHTQGVDEIDSVHRPDQHAPGYQQKASEPPIHTNELRDVQKDSFGARPYSKQPQASHPRLVLYPAGVASTRTASSQQR